MSRASFSYRVVPFAPQHAGAWKSLNEGWILECGFKLEPKDHKVLGDPQGEVLAAGGHIFIVETETGEAVGCCALAAMDDGGMELAKMAVQPEYRGRGLSRALMEAVMACARQLGVPRLYLETNSSLKPAISLYEAFGFEHLPKRDTPYERADVFMELRF